jgi:hypothetical protein
VFVYRLLANSMYIYYILYIKYNKMPYRTRKVNGKPCYRVYNKSNKRVFSKCATKENAARQLRLLRALEFNKKFVPRGTRKRSR